MALWVALALVTSATMYVETPVRRRSAAVIRTIAMLAVTWFLAAMDSLVVGGPILLVGWAGLAWATGVGRAWPAYEEAWRSAADGDTDVADKRALPVLATGVALICMGFAQGVSTFMFIASLRRFTEQSGIMQVYAFTWTTAVFPVLMIISGVLSLVYASSRNPWFPSQRAYAVAVFARGENQSAAMKRAVDAAPQLPRSVRPATGGV